MYIVYKTTNLINQKFYIGVHVNNGDDDYLGSGKQLNNGSEEHIKRCKEAGLIAAKIVAERRKDKKYNDRYLEHQR